MVQDLLAQKSSHENHLHENIKCVVCGGAENCDEIESCGHNHYCTLSCNEDVLFHRNCLITNFEVMANIINEAGELKSEIIAQKTIYEEEADSDNQVNDDFAFQAYIIVRLLESLHKAFEFNFLCVLYIENCNCEMKNARYSLVH